MFFCACVNEKENEKECVNVYVCVSCEQLIKKFYEQRKVRVDQQRFDNNPEKTLQSVDVQLIKEF